MTREHDMIVIEIGPQQATYRIHKALLLHHSDYFRKALQQCWKEGEERRVIIDDFEEPAFDVFVEWLYAGNIPQFAEDWLQREPQEERARYSCRMNLLRLKAYVVADRLGAEKFLNDINNHIVDYHIESPPWYESIIYAFENIPSERRILGMLVDAHCTYSEEEGDQVLESEVALQSRLPYDFLLRVMRRYRQTRETGLGTRISLHATTMSMHLRRKGRSAKETRRRKMPELRGEIAYRGPIGW